MRKALMPLRHLFAIAVLPFTVAVLVPLWVARRYGMGWRPPAGPPEVLAMALGIAVTIVGLTLFGASLFQFATAGRGTLAPWDPPRELVIRGPYRYVRHPMISGVILVLVGEALLLRSLPHAAWAAAFLAINLIYLPLLEEPMLVVRFGDAYRDYRRHVPPVVPRIRPWRGPA